MAAPPGLLTTLAASPVAEAMRASAWLYPIVEIVHIVGFSVLVSSVAMFDFRLLGCARAVPVPAAARMLLPWSVASLLVIVPAGSLLLSAHPHELAANRVFQLKLLLIALAGLNALLFHLGVFRSAATWHGSAPAPALARIHAVASLMIWVAVISCGRLLAYT